jgi:type II secretory pathway pseudopilin PulG
MEYKLKDYKAFTIAEVLITLLVVGVIVALLVPNLINDTQNAELKTAWKKAFGDFSQVAQEFAIYNNGNLFGVFNSTDDTVNEFSTYLITTKKCVAGTALGQNGCWSSKMYNFSGTEFDYWDISTWSRMVTNNGSLVAFGGITYDCTYNRAANQNACVTIAIDINGFKGPNTVGKDIYFGYLTKPGKFEPFGTPNDYWQNNQHGCDLSVHSNAYGFRCGIVYLSQ